MISPERRPLRRWNTARLSGAMLVTFGGVATLNHYLGVDLLWVMPGLGLVMCGAAFSPAFDRRLVLPGLTLLGAGLAILGFQSGEGAVPQWMIWPVLFGLTGISLGVTWAVGGMRAWVLIPAGVLLVCAGGGLGVRSFMRYQLWLKAMTRWWPVPLGMLGAALVLARLRRMGDEINLLD